MKYEKKKVLLVSTTRLQHDGLTEVVFSLCQFADSKKTDIYLLMGKGATDEIRDKLQKRNIRCIDVADRELNTKNYLLELYKLCKKNKFDVIHVNGNSATMALDLLIGRICQIKIRIAHVHNNATSHPIIHKLLVPLLNILVTDKVACSKLAGEWIFKNKFTVLPNAIDLNKFTYNEEIRTKLRKELECDDYFIVGHVGRFAPQKNHNFLVDVFYEFNCVVPDSKLLLIGEGELVEQVKDKVKYLGLETSVLFLGGTNRVHEYMQAMDIFLLPSIFEGFGIVGIEAQATGLPCIFSDIISREVALTKNCEYVSLQEGPSAWVEKLIFLKELCKKRCSNTKILEKAGFSKTVYPSYINRIWHL